MDDEVKIPVRTDGDKIAGALLAQVQGTREVANSLEHIAEAIDRFADALEELARAAKRGREE